MISKPSVQLLINVIGILYVLKCSPFYVVKEGNSIRLQLVPKKASLWLRKGIISTFVVIQALWFILGVYHEILYKPKQIERVQFYFVFAALIIEM